MKSLKYLLAVSILFFGILGLAHNPLEVKNFTTPKAPKVDPGLTANLYGAGEGIILHFDPRDFEVLDNKVYGTDTSPVEALEMIMPSTFTFFMNKALITTKWDSAHNLEYHLAEFFSVEDKLNFLASFDRRTLNVKEQIFDVLALAIKRGNQTTSNSLTLGFDYESLSGRQQVMLENHLLPAIDIFNSSRQASLIAKRDVYGQSGSYTIELKFLDQKTVIQFGDFVANELRKGNPKGREAVTLLCEHAKAALTDVSCDSFLK